MKWQVHRRLAGWDKYEGGVQAEHEGGVKAEAMGEGDIKHPGEEGMF